MSVFHGNLPDEIWTRLKQWAQAQAREAILATHDDCVAQVLHITAQITGRASGLRPDVVTFYANETAEMISKFRESVSAGAADLETAV